MQEEQDSQLFEQVLREVLPDVCHNVGRTNVRDFIRARGKVNIVPLHGADRMDWTALLEKLAAAVVILSQAMIAIRNFTDRKHKAPAEIITSIKLTLPEEMASKLDAATIEKLLTDLVKRT